MPSLRSVQGSQGEGEPVTSDLRNFQSLEDTDAGHIVLLTGMGFVPSNQWFCNSNMVSLFLRFIVMLPIA